MLKSLHHLAAWLAAPADDGSPADLLAHPLIERMTERELGDLPLTPIAKSLTPISKRKTGQNICPA
jgi:hypothetical protein